MVVCLPNGLVGVGPLGTQPPLQPLGLSVKGGGMPTSNWLSHCGDLTGELFHEGGEFVS